MPLRVTNQDVDQLLGRQLAAVEDRVANRQLLWRHLPDQPADLSAVRDQQVPGCRLPRFHRVLLVTGI